MCGHVIDCSVHRGSSASHDCDLRETNDRPQGGRAGFVCRRRENGARADNNGPVARSPPSVISRRPRARTIVP